MLYSIKHIQNTLKALKESGEPSKDRYERFLEVMEFELYKDRNITSENAEQHIAEIRAIIIILNHLVSSTIATQDIVLESYFNGE